jgi:hypothetical protein
VPPPLHENVLSARTALVDTLHAADEFFLRAQGLWEPFTTASLFALDPSTLPHPSDLERFRAVQSAHAETVRDALKNK